MNNETILKKAIEKAIHNGWQKKLVKFYKEMSEEKDDIEEGYNKKTWEPSEAILRDYINERCTFSCIFSHDFAKAFWKGEPCNCTPNKDKEGNIYHKPECSITIPDWRGHLSTMVLEEEPIKYLESFL